MKQLKKKEMIKNYKIGYTGNNSRFKGRNFEMTGKSIREAVENLYEKILDRNYFPQEDGSIYDCSGDCIAEPDDTVIEYDGGVFYVIEEISPNCLCNTLLVCPIHDKYIS